ncbi:hypothetical protein S101450_00050 [Komagataeibacter saccharivorans]|nr:hypothetical protein S101450_00050 [Komagataeibacter saccharivorans]
MLLFQSLNTRQQHEMLAIWYCKSCLDRPFRQHFWCT